MHTDDEINFDGFWVDYLESEIDPKLIPDLKELLRISKESRMTLKQYLWLRELVATVDPAHEEHLKKWDQKSTLNKIMDTCAEIEKSKPKSLTTRV